MKDHIPSELKDLISKSVKLLGLGIQDVYGKTLYDKIEDLRIRMKKVRASESEIVSAALEEVYADLKKAKGDDLHKIAKAFSLMLELINTCEAAYRSFRLKDYKIEPSKKPHSLVFVFTSHPTEARSRDFLYLMDKVEALLLTSLSEGFEEIQENLLHLLRLSLRLDLANNRRPEVRDEAEQIFHIVMDDKILMEQIALRRKGIDVFFRTWVGGDKDGHPKVGPVTMVQSLNLSRHKIISFISVRLARYEEELAVVDASVAKITRALKADLKTLKLIKNSDGKKVVAFKKKFHALAKLADKKKMQSPDLNDINELLWLYPAMVLPLEIREDHGLIHAALTNPRQPIARMLGLLKKFSVGMDSKWYVRGFVISMCQSADDMLAAIKLTKKMTGSLTLPIVPLFENEKGLTTGVAILAETLEKIDLIKDHKKKWGGRFEVMLGYSDSTKENGVLPGRILVEKALLDLEAFLLKKGLTPVFFHGSGGSVSRGGGSIKEQIAWWPQSALNIYKVTVQGETVQRHFHQPRIMRSQVGKIVEGFANYKPHERVTSPVIPTFTRDVQEQYKNLVQDAGFQELVSLATPYDFLNLLKIGSRPTARAGKGQFTIRAIPWILCWTQTRLLLPIWWGVGSAWQRLSPQEKNGMKEYFANSPLMQTYMKNLGFTLAKVELGVWDFHVDHSTLTSHKKDYWKKTIDDEFAKIEIFFKEMTGGKSYTWFRPELGESIIFRSSMIHPLNVIQKLALERKDNVLLRETVTGIACGMLTTG
jgi:phosphoenolpyruvate carboxylase